LVPQSLQYRNIDQGGPEKGQQSYFPDWRESLTAAIWCVTAEETGALMIEVESLGGLMTLSSPPKVLNEGRL
jgi:hypothetical protein